MENRFNNNRDFEYFVKQNADQYRMFPSEKVWKGIQNTLHTRRRWYGIGLGLLILTTGVVTWVMLTNSGKNRQVVTAIPETIVQQPAPEMKQKPAVEIAPVKTSPAPNKISFIATSSTIQKDLFITDNIVDAGINNINMETPVIAYNDPAALVKEDIIYRPKTLLKTSPVPRQVINKIPVNSTFSSVPVQDYSFTSAKTNIVFTKESTSIGEEKSTKDKNDIYPLSIESVVNSYIQIRKKRKTSLQVYVTPTISYRALRENKAFINSARNAVISANGGPPNTTNYTTDINSIVTHKPDIGLQMGFSAGFPLSKNLNFIGGLQFNVSKYDIQAFSHPAEVATIALSNPYGGTNTVSALTNYRNAGGYKADWLHNLYFTVAVPLGLELKLMGKRKTYVGVSGTVQPTYILSNRAYLLSTDYKNYAEIPSLIRKWNINTGFEMFAGYSTGKLKWRIGPQVRYQVMSSFVKKYPVQEHLFDFGLKLGLMLNK